MPVVDADAQCLQFRAIDLEHALQRRQRHEEHAARVAAEGMMQFAVTPYGAISVAIDSVNASAPALAAA